MTDLHRHRTSFLSVLVVFSLLALPAGCAYYNMLYNAKARYAEASRLPRDKDGSASRQQVTALDEVIDKCEKIIETYPKSRWVDDAMLLIARSRYDQDEFEAAVSRIDELENSFPKSDLLEKATFLKGQAYAGWGKNEEAVDVLASFIEVYPKSDLLDRALYYAGRSSMALGNEDRAMEYLGLLGQKFPKSGYRLDADIEVAEILLEEGRFDKSLEIYERLVSQRLALDLRFRVWSRMARAYKELGRYQESLDLLQQVDLLLADSNDPVAQATSMLLEGESYVGLDSLDKAIDVYQNVAALVKKSKYSAEARYRIGLIYQERLDSLELAKAHFDQVPQQYAGSEFAGDAIKRSSNISTLLKLRESSDEESPEARALREFSLAEVQLFQFNDAGQALIGYKNVLDEFPQSELAPKAAYAIGYIYGIVLGDSAKAHEYYVFLVQNYPGSQQAVNADQFYPPAAVKDQNSSDKTVEPEKEE